ncbi:MAG: cytosine deaminase-like metal-dependent hydrolase [Phycisphaerales bacterium]|nr:cytosine deaminase-like metal-dependent hydrolase [Phycisphaerales bacterium]
MILVSGFGFLIYSVKPLTTPPLLIRGGALLLQGQPQPIPKDILITAGKIDQIRDPGQPLPSGVTELPAKGLLISPPFVESHIHLDSALIDAGRCINQSGTLFEGIEKWREIKKTLTIESILERAEETLRRQAEQGVLFVRSHADVSESRLVPLKALLQLRERVKSWTTLQIVAFPQDGLYGHPDQLDRMEESLKLGADVVGGIPHYELTREDGVNSVHKIFDLANKYDRLIDVHCDEVDDPQSRFLEVMAACAIRAGNGPRVTASHTTAFGSYENAYANKLLGFLQHANINFVANPLINIVLQGRADTYPKRRGVTRVKELWQGGHNVSLGYDCIMDPWYALGTGNMLDAAHMAVHVCQMMGQSEIDACYDMVTWNAAKTLNLGEAYGIEEGREANLVLLDAPNRFEAIRTRAKPRHVISRGHVLCQTTAVNTAWP